MKNPTEPGSRRIVSAAFLMLILGSAHIAGGAASDAWFTQVQKEIQASEYHIKPGPCALPDVGRCLQAPNRRQGFRTYFVPEGIRVVSRTERTPSWVWAMDLTEFGYEGDERPVGPVAPRAEENRVEYLRYGIVEWYVNGQEGLEQGFNIPAAPEGSGRALCLVFSLPGTVQVETGVSGDHVRFMHDGRSVVEFDQLEVEDARGRSLPALFEQRADTRLAVRIALPADVAYPIVIDPVASAPEWSQSPTQANAHFGYSVWTAGDVNGDGYADVIVGVPDYDGGQAGEGCAYVYHGSSSGLSTSIDWTYQPNRVDARFGVSVRTAGDVNGDGYADVIIGADKYTNGQSNEGAAYVFLGGADGLFPSPVWTKESDSSTAQFGACVSTAGDVNGDGYDDVIVGAFSYSNGQTDEGGAWVYHGYASGVHSVPDWHVEGNQASGYLGGSVSTAGDVNGDGYDDVIVGMQLYDSTLTDVGRSIVYYGSASGLSTSPAWNRIGAEAGAEFGSNVACAGDVNSDGYSDVICSAFRASGGGTERGKVYCYYGSAGGLPSTRNWDITGDRNYMLLGYRVAGIGDVNGDLIGDVAVSAPYYSNGQSDEGIVYVYLGTRSGLQTTPIWTKESNQATARFGAGLGPAGDTDGDGCNELIVGAPDWNQSATDTGRAFLYGGVLAGAGGDAAWTKLGGQSGCLFGSSVAFIRSVNNDYIDDIAVGAPAYDSAIPDQGAVFVYYGGTNGPSTVPAATRYGWADGAKFGTSVAGAGDVNGDGYGDLIVGAPEHSEGGIAGRGLVEAFYGSSTGLTILPAWYSYGDQADENFGCSVAGAGDVNGDGFCDVVVGSRRYDDINADEGRALLFEGRRGGLAQQASWETTGVEASANWGFSVAGAGDVNGDGYSDVIVGAPGAGLGNGMAIVFHGASTGLGATYSWFKTGGQLSSYFGDSVDSAGDVNNDGFSDVIIGAPGYDNGQSNEGRAYVYYGSTGGIQNTGSWVKESDNEDAYFGDSVSGAGDLNSDGYADVIVGAMYYTSGGEARGAAFTYHGSEAGLNSVPSWHATGDAEYSGFGAAVDGGGDVNSDMFADVLVGGKYGGSGNEGEARVYYGSGESGGGALVTIAAFCAGNRFSRFGRVYPWSKNPMGLYLGTVVPCPNGALTRSIPSAVMKPRPFGPPPLLFSFWTSLSAIDAGDPALFHFSSLSRNSWYCWNVRFLYEEGSIMGMTKTRLLHPVYGGAQEQVLKIRAANHPHMPLLLNE